MEDVRKIIREEIVRALKILAIEAGQYDGYETPEITARVYEGLAEKATGAAEAVTEVEYHALMCDREYGGNCRPNCESQWETS